MSTKAHRYLDRRAFLGGAAAAAIASPLLVPRSVLGTAKAAAPNGQINVGMIGIGRQVIHYNLPQFLALADVRVVAVCDVDQWRLEDGKNRVEQHYGSGKPSGSYRGCATYRDFNELLARPDIDAVMISTPDHWHAPLSKAALLAGKDVCCEKPITRTIAEGREVSDLVARHKRVFRTDSEFRSHEYFHRVCQWVRNGRIGRLHTIRTGVPPEYDPGDLPQPPQPAMPVPEELDYERWQGPAPRAPYTVNRVHPRHGYNRPGWMRVLDCCDGIITNWGTHLNDIAQWGNNSDRTGPVEVEGRGRRPADATLWNVLVDFEVHYRYADGVRLIYTVDRPYVRFDGEEGWIEARFGGKISAEPASILTSTIKPDEIHLPLKGDKADFIQCVKTRATPVEDAEVGHRTTSLCHLGHIAIQLGEKLRWDPNAERFLGNPAANAMIDRPIHKPRADR